MKINLLPINKLKVHEKVSKNRVKELEKLITKQGKFIRPVVVEKKSLVVLDGHHRLAAMKNLGYTKIPAQLVNYRHIGVSLRHKNLPVDLIRELVVLSGSRGSLLPQKTTKHDFVTCFTSYDLSVLK